MARVWLTEGQEEMGVTTTKILRALLTIKTFAGVRLKNDVKYVWMFKLHKQTLRCHHRHAAVRNVVIRTTRLWARITKVPTPAVARDFSTFRNLQKGSGTRPVPYSMITSLKMTLWLFNTYCQHFSLVSVLFLLTLILACRFQMFSFGSE